MAEQPTDVPGAGSDDNGPGADELRKGARFEATPLTRPEYLGVMTHFYRAEVHR